MVDSVFYNDMVKLASELIGDFGEAGTFTQKGQPSGVDDYGNVIAGTPDLTIGGIVTPRLKYSQDQINNTNILSSDFYVFFDGDYVEIGMTIPLNGTVYRVVDNRKFQTVGNIKIYQKLQLRAG